MDMINSIDEMQQRAQLASVSGQKISFVPTMGYLHKGHLSLLEEGRKRGDLLVLSIFVNPTQFGQGEDFEDYPRDLQRDADLAEQAGVDIIFAPTAKAMYPQHYATYVEVEGITENLCGASRPGHFRGVATVVTKLFNIVQPDSAIFGTKDFQQLAVIRRMTADMNMPVTIVGMPIFRERDGLAMSSRNVYLSADQRQQALVLSQSLAVARQLVAAGELSSATIIQSLKTKISAQPDAHIDYIQICHQLSLADQEQVDIDSVLLLAVYVGQTRLIDNGYLVEKT
ncbi:MAG: pantoate--beta-alanine ligase [Deltaproteobacteria bacterium]|jgi:pantoate--beta-alanine ligase|nr:pantoate--beta-alanine ligase [Deltaproteobacteria bacterium]MCW8893959.1 pantoate--beta-alanine ligase [Deltaproteobacteria bacterium]MCW9050581.1 pantoate--beta-alanine ligase [Deltaproteobacteria bacterium]